MRYLISKNTIVFTVLMVLVSLTSGTCAATRPNPRWNTNAKLGQPIYDMKIYERLTPDPSLVRVDIAFEIMNDVLLFVREDTLFRASIEVDISIFDDRNKRIYRSVEKFDTAVSVYEKTNSFTDFLFGVFTVDLSPGDYNAIMSLTDLESRRREKVERQFKLVPHSSRSVALSSLFLTRSSEKTPDDEIPQYLIVGGYLSNRSSKTYVFYDVYRPNPLEMTQITLSVLDKSGLVFSFDSLSVVGGNRLTSYFMEIPVQNLGYGEYTVRLTARSGDKNAVSETGLYVNFHGLPGSIYDLEMAINQLKYIASSQEIKALKRESPETKERSLVKFWDENFPTPGETVNGKMREYYQRVEYSNRHFSSTFAGWETDRGHVLIIYGHPTTIERNQYDNVGIVYEIWDYDHLGRQFVFKDEYGFGEYRLTTPIW